MRALINGQADRIAGAITGSDRDLAKPSFLWPLGRIF